LLDRLISDLKEEPPGYRMLDDPGAKAGHWFGSITPGGLGVT
jgi:hypothetical protein